jgi:hypothetical protein
MTYASFLGLELLIQLDLILEYLNGSTGFGCSTVLRFLFSFFFSLPCPLFPIFRRIPCPIIFSFSYSFSFSVDFFLFLLLLHGDSNFIMCPFFLFHFAVSLFCFFHIFLLFFLINIQNK